MKKQNKKEKVAEKNKIMNKTNWKLLIACFIIVYGVAAVGSIFTSGETDSSWYESVRPSITPPNYVFPIVWNILFFLIALSLYYSWINANKKQKIKISWVFGINFILNILWSVLYFKLHNPFASLIEIVFIWISIIAMIYITKEISRKAAWLLVPYFLWVSFASVLNYLSVFG